MAIKWKVIAPLGVLAVVVLIVGINRFSKGPMEKVQSPAQTTPGQTTQSGTAGEIPSLTSIPTPQATGNVDDTAAALLSDSSDETSVTVKAVDDDTALLSSDSQAISDFGQVYNENEF